MVKKKSSRPRHLDGKDEKLPTRKSGKLLTPETPELVHVPSLHKKKGPMSGKERMRKLRKKIAKGDADPKLAARQKEIAKKSHELKKEKRAKEKLEYQVAIDTRDRALLELDETKKKLAEAELKCEDLKAVSNRDFANFRSLLSVLKEYDEMLKAVWNWR